MCQTANHYYWKGLWLIGSADCGLIQTLRCVHSPEWTHLKQKVTWDSVAQVSWKGRKVQRWCRMIVPWLGEKKKEAQQNDSVSVCRRHVTLCPQSGANDLMLLTRHRLYFEGICASVFPVNLKKAALRYGLFCIATHHQGKGTALSSLFLLNTRINKG